MTGNISTTRPQYDYFSIKGTDRMGFQDKIISFQRLPPVECQRLFEGAVWYTNKKPFSAILICEISQIFHVALSGTLFWRKHTTAY